MIATIPTLPPLLVERLTLLLDTILRPAMTVVVRRQAVEDAGLTRSLNKTTTTTTTRCRP